MLHHGNTSASITKRSPLPRRRGLATLWVILSIPATVILLCVVVEVGNIWLARAELENAVEAAALAAVQEWKATSDTDMGRARGRTLGLANGVRGVAVDLGLNGGGGGANSNLSCDGDIVLGTIDPDTGVIVFNADDAPGGGISGVKVSLCVRIHTTNSMRGDLQAGECPIKIFDFDAVDGGGAAFNDIAISFVTISVVGPQNEGNQADNFCTQAYFDLREKTTGGGLSTDRMFGDDPLPIFGGTGCQDVVGVDNVLGTVGATGVSEHSFSPTFGPEPPSRKSSTFTVSFPASATDQFQPNVADYFKFGVDSDCVGPNKGTGDQVAADRGGDFHGASVTVGFRRISDGSVAGAVTGTLVLIDCSTTVPGTPITPPSPGDADFATYHCSQVCFDEEELSGGIFGVRVNKSVQVPSVCCSLLGVSAGPFNVAARTYASCEGTNPPQLLRVDQYVCGGVVRDPCD